MQNFIAIGLFVVLIMAVFFPEELTRNHGQNSPMRSTVNELDRATGKRHHQITGAGFITHYLGMDDKKEEN